MNDIDKKPTNEKHPFLRGCGCLLTGIGALFIILAIHIAAVSFIADENAGKKNKQEWADYESHMATIDSLYEAGVPDSIIAERYPKPIIRQGGFATAIGGLFALGIVAIAIIPLAIGIVLLIKYKKKK